MTGRVCVIGNHQSGPCDGTAAGSGPEAGTAIFLDLADFRAGGSAANTATGLAQPGLRERP